MSIMPKQFFRKLDPKKEYNEKLEKIKKYRKALRTLLLKRDKDLAFMDKEELIDIDKKISLLLKALFQLDQTFFDIDRGLFLGLGVSLDTDDDEIKPIYLDWKKQTTHMGVLGASGMGKTVLMLTTIRQLIEKGNNVIVVDPKGGEGQEVLTAVTNFAKDAERLDNLVYFSPTYPELSTPINFLYTMGNEEIVSLFSKMIRTGSSDEFYARVAEEIILVELLSLEFLEKISFIDNPQRLETIEKYEYIKLKLMMKEKFSNKHLDPELQLLYQEHKYNAKVLDEVISPKEYENIMKYTRKFITLKELAKFADKDAISELRAAVNEVNMEDIRKNYPEEYLSLSKLKADIDIVINRLDKEDPVYFSKVSKTLTTLLGQLATGVMGELYCSTRINPLLYHLTNTQGDRLIAVIQPTPMKFDTLADLSVKMIMKQIQVMLGNFGASSGREINERLAIVIDEAESAVYPGIESLFNKARGLGATIYFYTQSFADFISKVGEYDARKIFDSTSTGIRFRMNDLESAERVAKEIGTIKQLKSMTMHDDIAGSRISVMSDDEQIAEAKDIQTLPVGRGVLKYDRYFFLVDFAYYGNMKYKIKLPTLKVDEVYANFEAIEIAMKQAETELQLEMEKF